MYDLLWDTRHKRVKILLGMQDAKDPQVINPFQPIVAFHTETSHLFCSAKQTNGFCMKCNAWLKWVDPFLATILSLRKHRESKYFLMFSRGVKWEHWLEIRFKKYFQSRKTFFNLISLERFLCIIFTRLWCM